MFLNVICWGTEKVSVHLCPLVPHRSTIALRNEPLAHVRVPSGFLQADSKQKMGYTVCTESGAPGQAAVRFPAPEKQFATAVPEVKCSPRACEEAPRDHLLSLGGCVCTVQSPTVSTTSDYTHSHCSLCLTGPYRYYSC